MRGIGRAGILAGLVSLASVAHGATGLFEDQTDVGDVTPAGTGGFNAATGVYTLTAAGANTWYHVDHFHYLWKKAAGDLALSADVTFPPHEYAHEPDPHRKGILMFRESLDAGGAYVGASWHGSGLIALQFRRERGANSEDVEINIPPPKTLRIDKRGNTFTLLVSMRGEPVHPVGASIELPLKEPFYVGLGAVSHDVNTVDKVEFSHVALQVLPPAPVDAKALWSTKVPLYSTLRTVSINDQFRRSMVIRSVPTYMQSANWAPDGKSIYLHEGGRIQKVPYLEPPGGGAPQAIDTGTLVGCSGNFGLSPDGKLLAVSCAQIKGGQHDVYVIPAGGGGPARKVTDGATSSYFHAWAPDSRTIAFTRGSAGKADIFLAPIEGGREDQLTHDTLNDGPDFTPDGKLIYFDSVRSGTTQIWRMHADGSAPEQVTDSEGMSSSPHVSPDGKAIAFLSQPVPTEPAADLITEAALKVITPSDGLIRTVASFQGNRGSLSMYGWGDATHVAYVTYQMQPAAPVSGESTAHASRPPITGISHIALYAADPAKTEHFYVHDLGAFAGADPVTANGRRYYFAPTQFVEILPLPSTASINRLDHVAFTTTDAQALRKYLASEKIAVPKKVERAGDGSQWFEVVDPEGNRIQFVQPPADAPLVPYNALSNHIMHVGFIIHDRALEDGFFRTVLGFRPYWFGGMKDDTPTWVSQQVPDGTDWLEYMIVGQPPNKADLGVLDHFSLAVPSAQAAYTLLWNGNRLEGQTNTPKIGRDAKWQLNLLDPDGTRAEVMELHAIGEPCCSPFTASDPRQ